MRRGQRLRALSPSCARHKSQRHSFHRCAHIHNCAPHKCAGLVDHSVHLALLSCTPVQYRVAVVKARALALAMRQQLEDSSKEQAALRGKYDAAVEAAQEVCMLVTHHTAACLTRSCFSTRAGTGHGCCNLTTAGVSAEAAPGPAVT